MAAELGLDWEEEGTRRQRPAAKQTRLWPTIEPRKCQEADCVDEIAPGLPPWGTW